MKIETIITVGLSLGGLLYSPTVSAGSWWDNKQALEAQPMNEAEEAEVEKLLQKSSNGSPSAAVTASSPVLKRERTPKNTPSSFPSMTKSALEKRLEEELAKARAVLKKTPSRSAGALGVQLPRQTGNERLMTLYQNAQLSSYAVPTAKKPKKKKVSLDELLKVEEKTFKKKKKKKRKAKRKKRKKRRRLASFSRPNRTSDVLPVREIDRATESESGASRLELAVLLGQTQSDSGNAHVVSGGAADPQSYSSLSFGLQGDYAKKHFGAEADLFYASASNSDDWTQSQYGLSATGKVQLPLKLKNVVFIPKFGLGYSLINQSIAQDGGTEGTISASGMHLLTGVDFKPSRNLTLRFDYLITFGAKGSTGSTDGGAQLDRIRLGLHYAATERVNVGFQYANRAVSLDSANGVTEYSQQFSAVIGYGF